MEDIINNNLPKEIFPEEKTASYEPFDFKTFDKVSLSPQYYEEVTKLFAPGKTTKKFKSKDGEDVAMNPERALAVQVASEFNAKYGMGSYDELRKGTSKLQPNLKFTDRMILETLSDLKDYGNLKGLAEAAGRRTAENILPAAGFTAGFTAGKKIQSMMPDVKFPMIGGPVGRFTDPIIKGAETGYNVLRFATPYFTGFGSSILTMEPGKKITEKFLGRKELALPDSYSFMRGAEGFADVVSFSPLIFMADKAATNVLTDYFTNRLSRKTNVLNVEKVDAIPDQKDLVPVETFGRDFDLSDTAKIPFGQQYKQALKTASLGTRKGLPIQGPLDINELNQRGVAAVLQGKTAPKILRRLLVIENAIKKSGKDAKENPKLTAFYELLAAGGGGLGLGIASEAAPFSGYEITGEIAGSIGLPATISRIQFLGGKLLPTIFNTYENISDFGLMKGTVETFKDVAANQRAKRGMTYILDELEKFGSIDSPEQLEALIKRLETSETIKETDGKLVEKTAAQLSEDPAIMAMEAALSKQFPQLSEQRKAAADLEDRTLRAVLTNLALLNKTIYGRDSLKIAAQIKEVLFENALDTRLTNAEDALLESTEQIKKSKLSRIYDEKTMEPGGTPQLLKGSSLQDLDNADQMELSDRLMNMLKMQKKLARDRQKFLYSKVGNLQVSQFFTENGEATNVPKFLRFLKENGPVNPEALARKNLSNLFSYGQRVSDDLGLGIDVGVANPAQDKFLQHYDGLVGSGALEWFDRFLVDENIADADVITPEMIDKVRVRANTYKRQPDVKKLYDLKTEALVEAYKKQQATEQLDDSIGGISLTSLTQIRSDALSQARDGNLPENVRTLAGQFAEAIQDDIENFARLGDVEGSTEQINALQTANAFSRAFADVYYRSFVGDALNQTKQGDYRLAPETIASNFVGNRFEPNFLKIRDIMEVGEFARNQGLEGAEEGIDSVTGVLDRIIRNARKSVLDPETKRIDENALKVWMEQNKRLENYFPELFADLKDYSSATALFDATQINNGAARQIINKQINFQSLLYDTNGEVQSNPTEAFRQAFAAGKNQLKAIDNLISVIPKKGETKSATIYTFTDPDLDIKHKFFNKKDANKFLKNNPNFKYDGGKKLEVSREDAIEGFKAVLFEFVTLGNTASKGKTLDSFRPDVVYRELFEKKLLPSEDINKIRGRGARTPREFTTVAEHLKDKKIFTDADFNTAKETLEQLIKLQTGDLADLLGESFEEAKPILDFGLAIMGSAIGTRSQALLTGSATGPGSIIAAGKGAQAMRNIFLKIPQSQKMLFTAQLLQDPKLLAKMLRRYGNEGNAQTVVQSVADYLKEGGFVTLPRRAFTTAFPESFEEPKEDVGPTLPPVVDDESPTIPPTQINIPPVSDASPAFNAVRPAPLTVAQASPAQSDPQTRQKYAALFPDDPTSAMIRGSQGGIGSLFG